MSSTAAPFRRIRLGLGLGLAGLFTLALLAAVPVRADDKDRDKQIKEIEAKLAELNKKLADLKATPQPKERKALTLKDLTTWKGLLGATLSRDGQWFAFGLNKGDNKGELIVRQTRGDKQHRVPADFVFNMQFSRDGRWLAFSSMSRPTPGQPMTGSGANVVLLRLDNGQKTEYEGAMRFAFAGETAVLAVHKPAASPASAAAPTTPRPGRQSPAAATPSASASRGSDLVLLDPATGKELVLGNVAEFGFDKKGDWLALVIDAQGQSGNGIQLRNMKTGSLQVLESSRAAFRGLNWTEKGDAFAVLCGKEDKAKKETVYSTLAFTNLAATVPTQLAFDPSKDPTFPKGMAITPSRAPTLSEDLSTVFFGIHTPKKAPTSSQSLMSLLMGGGAIDPAKAKALASQMARLTEKPDLVIWHGKDDRLPPQQALEAGRDESHNYLCAYRIADKKFIRLADETVKQVVLAPKHRFALGIDTREHDRNGSLDGKRLQDVYVIDVTTGKRQLALKGARYVFGTSPDGKQFLYYEQGHFHVCDMATMQKRSITKSVPVSFVNTEDDHNVVQMPTFPQGWTKDSAAVLLTDNWDVYKVPVGEGSAVNLTGNGKKDAIRYRMPQQFIPEAKGLDLDQPLYFSTYGEWTKKAGYARVVKGKSGAEALCFEDASFGRLMKARDAETYIYTRETISEYPDVYLTGADFKERKRLTAAVPDQDSYRWSAGSRLLEYKSKKGDRLQAALFLPAGYEPGKKYPTVVYIYEKLSQGKNRYLMPYAMGFNPAYYTSNGYAVLMPDIKYTLNDPGISAVNCVLPALDAAIKDGVVDKDRVGLQGHSWGGYQTAFLITQTDAFKAAVAGAPLTNLISMYSSVYWNTGWANQPIFESSQGRFTGPFWDLADAYVRNSPVFHAKNVKTPLMLLHNDKDGAVDFNQGIEYFNALRRLNKPVVMLQYKGENHGLVKPANRKDYTQRMKEFFDHHLMAKAAPGWLKDGVPHIKMSDHLEERAKKKD